ncbi:hypothetical protein D3C78_1253190 [compost metagenome]
MAQVVVHAAEQRSAVADGRVHYLALPRLLYLEQRGKNAGQQEHRTAAHIPHQVQGRRRRTVGVAHGVQQAREGDVVEVVARRGCQRAALAPAGHAPIDQLRVACQADIRPQPQALHDPRAEALDQHIGTVDQLQQYLIGPGLARVDDDTPPPTPQQTAVGAEKPSRMAIDTNHLRAHVCQHHRRERCRADRVHFHYFHTCQGSGHRRALSYRRMQTRYRSGKGIAGVSATRGCRTRSVIRCCVNLR